GRPRGGRAGPRRGQGGRGGAAAGPAAQGRPAAQAAFSGGGAGRAGMTGTEAVGAASGVRPELPLSETPTQLSRPLAARLAVLPPGARVLDVGCLGWKLPKA